MACASAAYDDNASVQTVRRKVVRRLHRTTRTYYCELCSRYHLRMDAADTNLPEKWVAILGHLAQGLRDHEIAPLVNMRTLSVTSAIREMVTRFYALNRSNLIAIVIALGVIDPNQFVPPVEEKEHAWPR